MADNVVSINNRSIEPSELSRDCVPVLKHLLAMAESGELTGIIAVIQTVNSGLGELVAGGTDMHPYATLGALEALTLKQKLSIMQNTSVHPAFRAPSKEDGDAPKQS